jgi:glucokinase
MTLAIGIDVGGTKLLGGIVDEDGKILARIRKDTPKEGGVALTDRVADLVRELMAQSSSPITKVGLSAAGFVSADRQTMLAPPNIAGWTGVNLGKELKERLGLDVIVENDANAAAWGEYKFGSGKGSSHAILLILGTGLGGGIILSGELYRGAYGTAGELGHMRLVIDGQLCGCGARGCFEQYAAGPALLRHAREGISAAPERAFDLLKRGDGTPAGLTGAHLTAAAKDGDRLALSAFTITGEWLGLGIASIVVAFDPDLIIISGGLVEAGDFLLEPARGALERAASFSGHPLPRIVPAQLGNDAGLVGVADLARQ